MRDIITLVENTGWTEDEMRAEAKMYRGDHDDGSPAYFDPQHGHWTYQADFPLNKFIHIMSAVEWKRWLESEITMLNNEYGP